MFGTIRSDHVKDVSRVVEGIENGFMGTSVVYDGSGMLVLRDTEYKREGMRG